MSRICTLDREKPPVGGPHARSALTSCGLGHCIDSSSPMDRAPQVERQTDSLSYALLDVPPLLRAGLGIVLTRPLRWIVPRLSDRLTVCRTRCWMFRPYFVRACAPVRFLSDGSELTLGDRLTVCRTCTALTACGLVHYFRSYCSSLSLSDRLTVCGTCTALTSCGLAHRSPQISVLRRQTNSLSYMYRPYCVRAWALFRRDRSWLILGDRLTVCRTCSALTACGLAHYFRSYCSSLSLSDRLTGLSYAYRPYFVRAGAP